MRGLKIGRKYRFPFAAKHVTWCLVIAIVISSCVGLLLYEVPHGMIKTYIWASIILSLFSLGVFVTAPVRIYIFNKLDALCIKKKSFLTQRKILPFSLINPKDPCEKEKILKYREYNAKLYAPTPLFKLQSRMEDIKYNIELRNLTIDIIVHVIFMAIVACIIYINKTRMGYYSTEIIKDLVLRGSYTNSIPFSKVSTYETFVEYLNETFFPALLLNFEDFNESVKKRKRRWIQERNGCARVSLDIKKRQTSKDLNDPENEVKSGGMANAFQRGWTMSPTLKLIGKLRLRQVRVKAETCREVKHLKTRNSECAPNLTPFNVERGSFSMRWTSGPAKRLTALQASPWTYQSAWNTRTLPIHGKYCIYPGGGYILELARDINGARIAFEFLNEFQWVDMRTRAVFIEFTVYCVNTNIFNVVTLIVEKTALEHLIPNYQIYTSKFMFILPEFKVGFVFMSILFICFLVFLTFREAIRIHRTSIVPYLKRGFALVDMAIVLLGLVEVIIFFCRYYFVSEVLKKLKQSDNKFVSFIYAANWHNWSLYIAAVLLCLSAFKLCRLLSFRVVFFQMQRTLNQCYVYFINLFIKQMVVILAFALFFNLTLANYSYSFSSFEVSLSTTIWRAVALDDSFDFDVLRKSPWYLGALFFGLFVVVNILFVNLFIAVTCLYLRQIQSVSLVNKYNILEYIKYLIMFKRQNDILHLKEEKAFGEERTDPAVIQLKDGKNKLLSSLSKKEKNKSINRKKGKKRSVSNNSVKEDEEEEGVKIISKDFVRKKQYDTTEYQDLAEDRAVGMKHLMLWILSKDEKSKRCTRENALKALFCTFTAAKAKAGENKIAQGCYFFAADKSSREIYDARRLLEMKKVVENTARRKGWLEDEEGDFEAINKAKDRPLYALHKKLCLLLKKHKLK